MYTSTLAPEVSSSPEYMTMALLPGSTSAGVERRLSSVGFVCRVTELLLTFAYVLTRPDGLGVGYVSGDRPFNPAILLMSSSFQADVMMTTALLFLASTVSPPAV